MSQVINTNISSLNAQRHLGSTQADQQQAMERLASGKRINSARDDAAGLAISERFTSQINGMQQAERNANDGISFAQTAEGAMEEMGNLLQRVRELAVQSANDTNTASDRRALDAEVQQAVMEIDRIAQQTQFNENNVLDGSLRELVFQVGANRAQSINVTGVDVRGEVLGAEIVDGQTVERMLDAEGEYSDLDIGELTVNGVTVNMDGVREVADAVDRLNASTSATGVQAFRADRAITEEFDFANPGEGNEGNVLINGREITFSGAEDDANALQNFLDAVNERAADTGVRAEQVGEGSFRFVSESDFRIDLPDDQATAFADTDVIGADGTRFERGVQLANDVGGPINLDETGDLATLGLTDREGNALEQERNTVSGQWAMSVDTRDGADNAIRTVDFALGQINSIRADLGAVQNRFEATTSNLQNVGENMQASRSRVLDADFAAETAAMTRADVLQQAGTSVLSQANQSPQNVLALLQ